MTQVSKNHLLAMTADTRNAPLRMDGATFLNHVVVTHQALDLLAKQVADLSGPLPQLLSLAREATNTLLLSVFHENDKDLVEQLGKSLAADVQHLASVAGMYVRMISDWTDEFHTEFVAARKSFSYVHIVKKELVAKLEKIVEECMPKTRKLVAAGFQNKYRATDWTTFLRNLDTKFAQERFPAFHFPAKFVPSSATGKANLSAIYEALFMNNMVSVSKMVSPSVDMEHFVSLKINPMEIKCVRELVSKEPFALDTLKLGNMTLVAYLLDISGTSALVEDITVMASIPVERRLATLTEEATKQKTEAIKALTVSKVRATRIFEKLGKEDLAQLLAILAKASDKSEVVNADLKD